MITTRKRDVEFVDRASCEKIEAERDRYREALEKLVALKDGPRDESYEREKPLAWQAARDAISRPSASEGHS